MRKLWLGLLGLLLSGGAQAQNFNMPPPAGVVVGGFRVVASCGAQSLSATQAFGTMDTTGALCVAATVTATATFALTAQAALPSLSPGDGNKGYESLSGGQYTQPIFGTQIVDSTHGLPVDVKASVLPTGAATAANQTTANSSLATIATNTGAAIPAGTNAIGTVIPYAKIYNTIAASQTAQALTGGGGGATGDYLSHCVIYPTSTSPGVLTVFDNTSSAANNAIAFAGGSTSLSNLTPISIPVGAVSVNGPWKVTTGANMVATCYGKFS